MLLFDDPRLLILVVDLAVLAMVLVRVQRVRLARRKRDQERLRRRHLAWVARQEEADRRRDAAIRDAEIARRQRAAVAQQAYAVAEQIRAGLARAQSMHDSAAGESFSAVPPVAEGNRGRSNGTDSGGAEKPHGVNDDDVRDLVYEYVKVDADGWRRWCGSLDKEKYPRVWLGRKRGGWTASYRLIYTWEQGRIPKGWTIDHACGEKDCMDHLECVTRAENLRRRHARDRGELPTGHALMAAPRR